MWTKSSGISGGWQGTKKEGAACAEKKKSSTSGKNREQFRMAEPRSVSDWEARQEPRPSPREPSSHSRQVDLE